MAVVRNVAAAVKIATIEILPLQTTLTFKRVLSKGAVGGEQGNRSSAAVLIRVEAADGLAGYAQVRPVNPWLGETTGSIVSAVRDYYGPALIGADALERERNLRRLEGLLPGNPVALAGVEIAIFDLLGKSLGLPVYSLLGGAPTRIPLDWSVSLNPLEKMVEEATRAVREYGVGILCLKAGPSQRWREDVAAFQAVREAVGEEIEIGMDPNEGYDLATALRALRALAEERVAYVEQPLPRQQLEAMASLRVETGVPVMLDESAVTLADAYRALRAQACDGLVLKLWKSGGYSNARKMATLAEAAGATMTVGGTAHGSLLEAAAYAHLYASLGAPALAAEFVLGLNVVDRDPIAEAPAEFSIAAGQVSVPSRPGLGVEVDLEAARGLAFERHVVG